MKRLKLLILILLVICPVSIYAYEGRIYGDVNLDGEVNADDSTYLSRYLARWDGYILTDEAFKNADVNLDGEVSSIDSVILSRYLANFEGHEFLPYLGDNNNLGVNNVWLSGDDYEASLQENRRTNLFSRVMRGDIISLDPSIKVIDGNAKVSFKITIIDRNGKNVSDDVVELVKSLFYFNDDLNDYADEETHEVYSKSQLARMNSRRDEFELEQEGNVLIYKYLPSLREGENITLFNNLVIPYDLTEEEVNKIANFQLIIEPMATYGNINIVNVPNTGLTVVISTLIGLMLIGYGGYLLIKAKVNAGKTMMIIIVGLIMILYNSVTAEENDYILNRISVEDTKLINASDYTGVICDGENDDTEGLRAAVSDLNALGGVLKLPYKKQCIVKYTLPYTNSSTEKMLTLTSNKDIVLDMNDSSISLFDGREVRDNLIYGYDIILLKGNTATATVKNGELIGDRKTHCYYDSGVNSNGSNLGCTYLVLNPYYKPTHEFGAGITVASNLGDVFIENMNVHDMIGDGIFFDSISTSGLTTVKNTDISYNRRQGISVVDGSKIKLDGLHIYKIGNSDGIDGAAPRDGIDIEPDKNCNTLIEYIYINNVNVEYNHDNDTVENRSSGMHGISVSGKSGTMCLDKVQKLTIENSKFDGAILGLDYYANDGILTLNNNEIYNTQYISIKHGIINNNSFYIDNRGTTISLISSDVSDSRFYPFNGDLGNISNFNGSKFVNTEFNKMNMKFSLTNLMTADSADNTYKNCKLLNETESNFNNSVLENTEFRFLGLFSGNNLNFKNSSISSDVLGNSSRAQFKCENCLFETANVSGFYNAFKGQHPTAEDASGCVDITNVVGNKHLVTGNYSSMTCIFDTIYGDLVTGKRVVNCHEDSAKLTCN